MKKKVVAAAIACMLIVSTIALSACGKKNEVAGMWVQADTTVAEVFAPEAVRMIDINSDGAYIYYRYGTEDIDHSYAGTWEMSKSDGYYTFTGNTSGLSSQGLINEDGNLVINFDGGGKDTIGAHTYEHQ